MPRLRLLAVPCLLALAAAPPAAGGRSEVFGLEELVVRGASLREPSAPGRRAVRSDERGLAAATARAAGELSPVELRRMIEAVTLDAVHRVQAAPTAAGRRAPARSNAARP